MSRWTLPRVRDNDAESINRSIEDLNLILAELEQLEQQMKGQGGYVAEMSSDLRMNGNAITGLQARPKSDSSACSLAFHKTGRFLYTEGDTFVTDKAILGVAAVSPAGLATLDQIQQSLGQLINDLDSTAAPPKVADVSAIGTANQHFAREQHTHQGVNLDAAQTLTGIKTFVGATPLVFDGATANASKTTLTVTDPSGARTFTLPDANSVAVQPDTGASHNFLTAISALGVISKAQPSLANISGYTEGTFTITATGFTAGLTGTAKYIIIGKLVVLLLPNLQGTSNATTFTLTGLPAGILPANNQYLYPMIGADNSVVILATVAINTGSSTLTLFNGITAGAWTASGIKAIYAVLLPYLLI